VMSRLNEARKKLISSQDINKETLQKWKK
jgi:hypothetical protein